MKTIAKIFIGALIATGGIAFYMNWKKKQAEKSTATPAPASGGGTAATTTTPSSAPASTSATSANASVPVTSTGFAPAATNPAAQTTTTTVNAAAKTRVDGLIAAGGVVDVYIAPDYGIVYTQNGVLRSSPVPEIVAKNQDYINSFQNLIKAAGIAKAV